ncbi:MAG TPA: DUF721 domain-containing protein [Nitrospira sp.]
MRGQGTIDSFGSILTGLAKRLGIESRLFELRLQHHWDMIVGDPIAAHTCPDQIRFKKLYLIVRSSIWMQQLTFLKPSLIAKLNEQAGTELITDIAFRVGEIPLRNQQTMPAPPQPASPAVDETALAEASAPIAGIHDPVIRQRFTEVIGTYLARVPPPSGSGPSHVP